MAVDGPTCVEPRLASARHAETDVIGGPIPQALGVARHQVVGATEVYVRDHGLNDKTSQSTIERGSVGGAGPPVGSQTVRVVHTTHIQDESVRESESSRRRGEIASKEGSTNTQSSNIATRSSETGTARTLDRGDHARASVTWNNDSENINNYASPPLLTWEDDRVNEEFKKKP